MKDPVYIFKGTLYDGLTITVQSGETVAEVRLFNPVTKETALFEKDSNGEYYLTEDKTANLTVGSYSIEVYDSDNRMLSSAANFARVVESSKGN